MKNCRAIALACIALAFGLALAFGPQSARPASAPRASAATRPQASDRLCDAYERKANEAQPPLVVMDLLGIRPGLSVGEVGAGRGRFTVHLAERVGSKGRVFANDIDGSALADLGQRCSRLGLANVQIVRGLPDDARLPAGELDLVVMTWVYHHVDQHVALLKSLLPSLKPWGFVAMVEPTPQNTERGRQPLTRESVERDAWAAGFSLDSVIEGRLKEDNVFVLRPAVPDTPEMHDPAKVRALWLEYVAWREAWGLVSPRDWGIELERRGVPALEIRRRLKVAREQATEQPEGVEMIYDATYGKPLTGELDKDGFKTSPNAFLVEAAAPLKPAGQALDVGAGMGRNALHLARQGWDVTAIDLSEEGLKVLGTNAAKSGLRVDAVKTSYQDYDFGRARWDLVAMILSWAPMEDPAFLMRVKASIKPGGHLVFEHVLQRPKTPFPPGVHALEPGVLRALFGDFEVLVYREVEDYGDWGGPPTAHVRMVARKRT